MMTLSPSAVLSGTGHRPNKIGAQEKQVRRAIRERLITYQPRAIVTGMAEGFDQWFCEEALALGVSTVAAVPFFGQESFWPYDAQKKYHALLARVQRVELLQKKRPQSHAQTAEWMQDRNVWMVDHSDGVLACYNGDPNGGTANCVRYAKVRRRPLDIFDPYALPPVEESQP